MSYPTKILPNPIYKNIDCELSDFHLIRYVEDIGDNELTDAATGELKVEYICSPKENIADLSTSLLGVFETQHIQIQLTKDGLQKYNDYCDPDSQVEIPTSGEDYILNDKRLYWTVPIEKVHGQKVDYTSSTNHPYKAICQVTHTPMKWNYWHFSIRWQVQEDFLHVSPDLLKKKGWIKRLCHSARAMISNFANTAEPNYYELGKQCYIKDELSII